MALVQILHMNKGAGDSSYAKNSTLQHTFISIGKPIREEAVKKTMSENVPASIGIADLGCSSGPNTLSVISDIVDAIFKTCRHLERPISEEFRIYLNDLPTNDFNNVFELLPEFHKKFKGDKECNNGDELGRRHPYCFISAVPGSFYGRLFPSKSLHFVHSSSSLHWLSQVPTSLDYKAKPTLNKGKIYISKTSPICVLNAYALQFQKDFSLFLKSRSEEIVTGGRMVLSFLGRRFADPTTEESCYQFELLAQALMSMVYEGLVDKEMVDSFNTPYYAPCPEELEIEILKEGSFNIERFESFEVDWDGSQGEYCASFDGLSKGQRVAKTIRAVLESILEYHFGQDIMDDLFQRYSEIVDDHLLKTRAMLIYLVISVVRND